MVLDPPSESGLFAYDHHSPAHNDGSLEHDASNMQASVPTGNTIAIEKQNDGEFISAASSQASH